MKTAIIGIDPGLNGAIAVIFTEGFASVESMPIADGHIDPAGLANLLRYQEIAAHAYVERVGAMPKQGVSSTFKFGEGFGMIKGVLATLGIPYTLVQPSVWKKAYGLGTDKEASRARAIQLFPKLSGDLKRKKDDGRAEALLIAEYGRRNHV